MKLLRNEKGIALAMILILSVIALTIIAGLLYIITSGTQISGMQKRYKTALEAGGGGADITYKFVALRGVPADTDQFKDELEAAFMYPAITTPAGCSGTNIEGNTFTGLAAKLNTPSTSWSSCGVLDSVVINPDDTSTYDMSFDFQDPLIDALSYRVYTKISDTVEGNSGPDTGFLISKGVVGSGGAEIAVVHKPYLYTIEVDSQNIVSPLERAKLSILYQY
jgi:hypothetical protein